MGFNQASIAYRTNLNKSNIHFSRDVFKYLNRQENAFIIVSDFSSFFDKLDHKYLKERLKELLNVETLSKALAWCLYGIIWNQGNSNGWME